MNKVRSALSVFTCCFVLFFTTGCPLTDPCANVTCESGSTCNPSNGTCEADSNPCDACGDNELCVENECILVDLCDAMDCDDDNPCTTNGCVNDTCIYVEITCDDGFTCNENGECVDLCEGNGCDDGDSCTTDSCDTADGSCSNDAMVCDDGLDCDGGECVNLCDDVDCDDDDDCTVDSCSHGECTNEAITCDAGNACVGGECVDECEVVNFHCNDGFICNQGACVEDLCFGGTPVCLDGFTCNSLTGVCDADNSCSAVGQECPDDLICVDGACVVDPCEEVECEDGEECVDGTCVAEADPCDNVTCDDGNECVNGTCELIAGDATAGEAYYTSHGCIACHKADAAGPPSILGEDADEIFAKLSGAESHVGGTQAGVTEQDARDLEAWLATL